MRIIVLAATLLAAVPALADVKAGVDAWGRGDYRKAVEEWRGPAVAGDPDAQFNLGQAYKLGRGVPVDPALAESWFRKAALQGHEQAEENYGLALFQYGRKQEAVLWLEKAAARDDPRTQLVLGTMLFNGDGVTRDYQRAYGLMTRAAAPRPAVAGRAAIDGLPSARETLAQMDGYISSRDRERGTQLAQELASAGAARPVGERAGSVRQSQPVQTAAAPRAPEPTPAKATAARPVPKPQPTPVAVAKPMPPAPKLAPMRTAATGRGWKVQLGAFRSRANAETQWNRVRAKLGGTSPAYVASSGFTRLQATGFANKSAAQSACRASGVACVVVAP